MNLFVVAMTEELDLSLDKFKFEESNGLKFYHLDSKNILVFSDVCKENAMYTIAFSLSKFKHIKHVFNIGTAGSAKEYKKWFDILIAKETQFLDIDFTPFGYELNQIPRVQKTLFCDSESVSKINKILLDNGFKNISAGTVGTTDSFITQDNYKKFLDSVKVDCFEMESSSLNLACSRNNVKFNVIKVLSDNIFSNQSSVDFNANLKECSKILTKILYLIIDNF